MISNVCYLKFREVKMRLRYAFLLLMVFFPFFAFSAAFSMLLIDRNSPYALPTRFINPCKSPLLTFVITTNKQLLSI